MMKRNLFLKGITLSLMLSTLILCVFVYESGRNKRTVYLHREGYHRIIHQLIDRKVVANQSVQEIVNVYPPTKAVQHDEYLTLQYFKNDEKLEDCCVNYSYYIHIIAKNNRLVKAFAAEGLFADIEYVFFDDLSGPAEDEYWESRVKNAVMVSNL